MRSWGSWVSEIRAPNQKTRIWLGSYSTPEAAAHAYDAALLCLKGSSAALNFPQSSPHHNIPSGSNTPTLLSPKSIQRLAAAAAANAEHADHASPVPPSPPSPVSSVIEEASATSTTTAPAEESSSSLSSSPSPATEMEESWFDDLGAFQSPTCMDFMLGNCSFFVQQLVEDQFDEVGDISLWNFV